MGSNEVKIKLKSHLAKLIDKKSDLSQSNSQVWEIFWKLPTSMDDILSVFNPPDIRYFRDSNIKNFIKLLLNLTNRLIYLSKLKKTKLSNFPTTHLLNCIRILTVILPFVYEKSSLDYIEDELFWNRLYHTPVYSTYNEQDVEEVDNEDSESEDLNSDDGIHTASATVASADGSIHNDDDSPINSLKVNHDEMAYSEKPLGSEMIDSLLNLLFTLNFTVESRSKSQYNSPILANDYQPIVWEPGLEVEGMYRDTKLKLDSNRLEIIRLLLVLFSKSLYTPVSDIVTTGSKFLTVLITATDGRKFYILCLSLWNLVLRSIQSNDATNSNNINSLNNNINGLDIQTDDYKNLRILMVTNSLQLFTLMVIYPLPKKDLAFLYKHNIIARDEIPRNRTRIFLGRITNSKDIQMIIKNMTTPLFKSFIDNDIGTFSYIMKTSKLMEDKELNAWSMELLMILLEFFQCNAKFRAHFAEIAGPDFFVLLAYYIIKFKNQKKYYSFVKLCIYFLLIITADIRLSAKLLITFDIHFYDSLPEIMRISTTPTSYRDFLIIHICNIINSDYDYLYVSPLIQTLYNLVSLHAFILEFNKRENKEVLVNRRIKDLSKCPPSQISYGASTSLLHLVNRLSKYNNIPAEFLSQLEYLSLIMSSCCHAICRDPYDTVVLLYVFARNSNILSKLAATIKRVSDQLYTDLLQKEKKDYDSGIQQQQIQFQCQMQCGNNIQENMLNNESKDSLDMPALSRQNTQTTLESIPSIRSMPVVTRQTSQISIPSVTSGYPNNNNNFNDDGIDPMANTGNNNNSGLGNNSVPNSNGSENNEVENSNDPIITEIVEEVFNAEFPIGMTQKSKDKAPYYERFEFKWSGRESLTLLRECLKAINNVPGMRTEDASKPVQPASASIIIQKLLKTDLETIIGRIEKPDFYNPTKIDYQPLKFKWTNATLGWYISLLWSDIFLNYNSFASKGILAEISSGFSAIKKASSSWGFGSWKLGSSAGSASASPLSSPVYPTSNAGVTTKLDLNVYYDNVINRSIWFGTHVQLFRINPVLLKEHFNLQHGKSELSNSVNNFNMFSDVFWKRNSVTSPLLGMRNGSGVFTEGFWKRQGGRPGSVDRRDSDGSLKMQLSRNSISSRV